MKLIVGLGNPGDKYIGTRHNLGFETLDYFLKKYEPVEKSEWDEDKKSNSLFKKIKIKNSQILLTKPLTFMNKSGEAVSKISSYYKIEPADIVVIHDELDLPLGKIQIRYGGGTAGHNGLESIIDYLGTDKFIRIRMGVGKPIRVDGKRFDIKNPTSIDNYVLQNFSENELPDVRNMIKHVQKNLELLLSNGFETFMSRHYKK